MAEHDPNLVLAAELQQKFQLYLLALTFGILSLSIQTASFETPLAARIAELLGWLLLLVSGVVGLWRLEGIPRIHQFIGLKQLAEDRVHELEVKKARGIRIVGVTLEGRDYSIDESIAMWRKDVELGETLLEELARPANIKYRVQRYAFVLGLVALVISRGYGPMLDIINQLGRVAKA